MRRLFTVFVALLSIALITAIAGGVWLRDEIVKPGTFAEQRDFVIEQGSTGRSIAAQLQTQDLITEPKIFYGLLRLKNVSLKAGEYAIPAHASMADIARILGDGQTIQRQFTLAEGLTVKQALILLAQNEFLTGMIETPPAEGSLLPETYSFTRGETRQAIVKRMQESQTKVLDELWAARDTTLPITTKEQAVVLASIVEKETGKAIERPKIAGLFYNRLKIGMPLQTDPTVVYAITDGLGHMGGKRLLLKDLEVASPYNTYKVVGLPPGPIANPGRASLEAVFKPEQHDYLFFVADGTGGHVFSENLAGHNRNVTEWRKIRKENEKKD